MERPTCPNGCIDKETGDPSPVVKWEKKSTRRGIKQRWKCGQCGRTFYDPDNPFVKEE